jgi:hypothetical protein
MPLLYKVYKVNNVEVEVLMVLTMLLVFWVVTPYVRETYTYLHSRRRMRFNAYYINRDRTRTTSKLAIFWDVAPT